MTYQPKPESFFIARIGKRIYRDKQKPCCKTCTDAEDNGILIKNKQHAEYLALIDTHFATEGIYSNYREVK